MNSFQLTRQYAEVRAQQALRRVCVDDRGSATAEQIVMIAAAVIGAAAVGVIVWNKMNDGANAIETPAP